MRWQINLADWPLHPKRAIFTLLITVIGHVEHYYYLSIWILPADLSLTLIILLLRHSTTAQLDQTQTATALL